MKLNAARISVNQNDERSTKFMDKNMTLEDLDFSVRTWKVLKDAGVKTLGDLIGKSANELMEIPHMGRKSLTEIAGKFQEFGLELAGFDEVNKTTATAVRPRTFEDRQYWAEIRNDYFEMGPDILPEEGDVLARVSIDAWKTEDDNEEGCVIACVMLSKHGDVLVDYRDPVARIDEAAQKEIKEAQGQLREYFAELQNKAKSLDEVLDNAFVRDSQLKAVDADFEMGR